ncbi:hypothetical protein LEN26_019954 [Aphanomyces euteiches]|nr:hypothetical protein LEN26_019954 [Aphanomyces euteiches]KAH9112545.1 hypothetical protein AeMF1_013130 [Aphanomyces euteiches]KAH9190830.1 hypothetical protein AeNC1_007197 [Aphanomyces euteiches]
MPTMTPGLKTTSLPTTIPSVTPTTMLILDTPSPTTSPETTPTPTTTQRPTPTANFFPLQTPTQTVTTTVLPTPTTSYLPSPLPTTSWSPPLTPSPPAPTPPPSTSAQETTLPPTPTTTFVQSSSSPNAYQSNPTDLPMSSPLNLGNWPSAKLKAADISSTSSSLSSSQLSTTDTVFQNLPTALISVGLVPLIAFYIGLWVPAMTGAPWLLPHTVWAIQTVAAISCANFGSAGHVVPTSLLHSTDGLSWLLFLVPGDTSNRTLYLGRNLLVHEFTGVESFALRRALDEQHLFGRCWLGIAVIVGVLVVFYTVTWAIARYTEGTGPAMATILHRLCILLALVATLAAFPLSMTATFEIRQDSHTIGNPHASAILAGLTLVGLIIGVFGLGVCLYAYHQDEFEAAKATTTWLPWIYGCVGYPKRLWALAPLVLQIVCGALVGGLSSLAVGFIIVVFHATFIAVILVPKLYSTDRQAYIIAAVESVVAFAWLCASIGAAFQGQDANGLGYTVVSILLVAIAGVVAYQVMLVWSACASYTPAALAEVHLRRRRRQQRHEAAAAEAAERRQRRRDRRRRREERRQEVQAMV